MRLYSTKNRDIQVDLKQAVFQGLPKDNGLFMPNDIPRLPEYLLNKLSDFSFSEIGFHISKTLFQGSIPDEDIRSIVEEAINFPAPLVKLDDQKFILELFHLILCFSNQNE